MSTHKLKDDIIHNYRIKEYYRYFAKHYKYSIGLSHLFISSPCSIRNSATELSLFFYANERSCCLWIRPPSLWSANISNFPSRISSFYVGLGRGRCSRLKIRRRSGEYPMKRHESKREQRRRGKRGKDSGVAHCVYPVRPGGYSRPFPRCPWRSKF